MKRFATFAALLVLAPAVGCHASPPGAANAAKSPGPVPQEKGEKVPAPRPEPRRITLPPAQAHALFSGLLETHVSDGRVDYENLCRDDRLRQYTTWLSMTDPDTIAARAARLAFWINAYNAFTLEAICDEYPVESINDLHFGGRIIGHALKKTVWDKEFIRIHGEDLSLNDIEHKILRGTSDDVPFDLVCGPKPCPEIHFALVCAAKSCPPLRPEAYVADKIDAQLDDQARIFFAANDKNHFDLDKQTAYLSKILDWYKGDFGPKDEERLRYIARFLPGDIADAIRSNAGEWKIEYTDYDWSLNDVKSPESGR